MSAAYHGHLKCAAELLDAGAHIANNDSKVDLQLQSTL